MRIKRWLDFSQIKVLAYRHTKHGETFKVIWAHSWFSDVMSCLSFMLRERIFLRFKDDNYSK